MSNLLQSPLRSAVSPPSTAIPRCLCWVAGGADVGMGHVMRTLELARILEQKGIEVAGCITNGDRLTDQIVANAGYRCWNESEDFPDESVISGVDVLLVDRPTGFDRGAAELAFRHGQLATAALDDFDMENGRAGLVINLINHHPNLSRPRSPTVRYYEGLEHAIIRREFTTYRAAEREVPPRVRKVLITFGGSDPRQHTDAALNVIERSDWRDISFQVVIGPNFTAAERLIARARALGVEVVRGGGVAPYFAGADLALCGGGTTMLELAYLGTPSLVIPQSPAELKFASALVRQGAIALLNPAETSTALRPLLAELIDDASRRAALGAAARAAVDGRGPERIAEHLLAFVAGRSR